MKKIFLLSLAFLLAISFQTNVTGAFAPISLAAESPRPEFEERRRAVGDMMEAATVWIVIDNPRDFNFGSGFIVGDGYIMTNAHVTDELKRGGSIYVLNEKIPPRQATIIGSVHEDKNNAANVRDLALLRFDPPSGAELPVLSFNFDVKRMDRVSAWGYPAMATQFDIRTERLRRGDVSRIEAPPVIYTEGTVNAIVRGKNNSSILHSASIAGGNSGGPLVNSRGEVVGINTWGYKDEDEGAFLNGAQLAGDVAHFLAEHGVAPRLAAGQQMQQQTQPITAQTQQEEAGFSRFLDMLRPDRNTREVAWGDYSLTLPRGWSVAEQEEDTLVVANDDDTTAVALYMGDLDGRSLRRMARELSRTHDGTDPELDDDIYTFTFIDEDGDTALACVGEGDDEDSFFVIYVFGDFEDPGIEEFLNSII